MLTQNQHRYETTIRTKTTSAKQQHWHKMLAKTMLTQEQFCNKNIKGKGTQSGKQQPRYNNNVDTKTT